MRTVIDRYDAHFGQIVQACMTEAGCDPDHCFDCGKKLTDKTRQIHHLKYDGATVKDLRFGCRNCNMKDEYIFLE